MENIKDINLVRKIAWEFHYKTNIKFEELFSEAVLAYLKGKRQFKKGKCKESYYLWICMKNALINFCQKEQNSPSRMDDLKEKISIPSYHPIPYFELFETLPQPCKVIANLITENPILYITKPPKIARGIIIDQLRQQGWSWSKIWRSLNDIKVILNETPENCILY